MKKIILLFVFVLFVKGIYSQKYQAFDSTTVWGVSSSSKIDFGCYTSVQIKYFVKGYEINNSNIWLKIYASVISGWVGSQINCASLFPGYVGSYTSFSGYLFNDTINKKVFFHYGSLPPNHIPVNNSSTANELIYDFNKVVGDSMYINPNIKFKITSIDSILFSGKYHKRFLTVATPSAQTSSPYVSFTEGVGCSTNPFAPKANGFESGSTLTCFGGPIDTIAVTNHTMFTYGGCGFISVGVKEIKQFDLTIYPNPASNHLSVLFGENNYDQIEYKIFNVIGQQQLSGIFKENRNEVNLAGIKKGIYIINFYKDKQIILSKKIIIEGN